MGFITAGEIDKILGRMTESPVKSDLKTAIDTNRESVEDKANLRAIHNQKKAQDFASMYAPRKERTNMDWTGRDNGSFFNNQALSAGIVRRSYAFITDLCVVGFIMVAIGLWVPFTSLEAIPSVCRNLLVLVRLHGY